MACNMETLRDCIFFGSKITVEIKRLLLLGRKAVTNLDSILKIRDLTLQAKVCRVKAMVLGVQPRWIQGIQRVDGVGMRKTYLLIDIRLD